MAAIVERSTTNGDRRIYVVWRDPAGKQHWTLATSSAHGRQAGKKDAVALRSAIEDSVNRYGTYPAPAEIVAEPKQAPTFAAYAETWLETRARHRVSERVLEAYRATIRRHLAPTLGELRLDEIRKRHVNDLLAELAGASMAKNTLRNVLIPLRKMLADAVDDELIVGNPAARVEIPQQAPERKAAVPTHEELKRILSHARPDAKEALTIMAALGIRRGEAFALRWRDIDFDGSLVTIRATNHRGVIYDRTKTRAGERLVPLFESARKTLAARRLRLAADLTQDDVPVFSTRSATPLDPGNFARRDWLPALKAAGLEKRFHLHDLRHYAATRLDEQGMAGKLRTEVLGHADEAITNSIYTHVRRERVAAAASSFDPLADAV